MQPLELVNSIKKKAFVFHDKSWRHEDEYHYHYKAQLMYVESGYQYLHTENNHFLLPQNHIAWIPSNMPHKTNTSSELISLRTLYFDIDSTDPYYKELHIFSVPEVLKQMILYSEKWSLVEEYNSNEAIFLEAILSELPSFTQNAIPIKIPIPTNPKLLDITKYIDNHYNNSIIISEVAKEHLLSTRTLERLFKKETGITLAKYLQMVKIIKSIELLSEGNLTVNEVAYKVGYNSVQSYSNVFMKLIGKRPSEFFRVNNL